MSVKKSLVVAVVAVSLLALPACSNKSGNSTGGTAGASGMVAQLVLASEVDSTIGNLANYNPYSPTPLTSRWLFEPLIVRNGMTCAETPWLATKATWEGATKLTLAIRQGVKWSDGKDFSAKDVAFTFNLAKKYPAMDQGGLWTGTFGAPAKSVTADGNNVVIVFSGNAAAKYDAIIATKILPEHVYSTVGDPTKYVDKNPVSTGPYKVGSYNGRRLVLERRADYWQADKIKVQELVQEGTFDASGAAMKLKAGQLDAYWGDIPNPQKSFVDANPKVNHFWYAPNGITVLTGNTEKAPFTDQKFREAISYAMNKEDISLKATYGIMKPASQSGLKLPSMKAYLPAAWASKDTVIPFDVAKANSLLDAAGYTKGADGKRTNPNGSKLALTFTVQAGWIDYQAMADVVVKGLNSAGIDANVVASAPDSVDSQKKSGDYQMVFEYLHGGCEFVKGLGAKLASNQIPTAQTILPNVERWNNSADNAAVASLSGSTTDVARKQYVGQLVDSMLTQFPVTSLIYAPARLIYRTDKAVGWPSEQDPYAHPTDNPLLIITHLRPAGK
jgi:peptide/nickel transport system substrate-binding protein